MEIFSRIRTALFSPGVSSVVFKVVILLNIFLGIPFLLFTFSSYHLAPIQIESAYYSVISILFGLLLFLNIFVIKSFWKISFDYLMLGIILLSLFQQMIFRISEFQIYNHIAPYCQIISPDGQKTYYVQNVEPSSALVEIGIKYKEKPFIAQEMGMGVAGGWGARDFCAAQWIDNDTILVSASDGKEQITYQDNLQMNWEGMKNFTFLCIGIALFIEILKKVLTFLIKVVEAT